MLFEWSIQWKENMPEEAILLDEVEVRPSGVHVGEIEM